MQYTNLGDTGLSVSRLCLGCANVGSGAANDWDWTNDDRERSLAVIERAIDAGINYIDTANFYSKGESEAIVGEAIDGRRDDIVLATKVGNRMGDGPNAGGLSKKHIIEQAERSLERLDTDYIDLYQVHRWDDETPLEETLVALDYLVDEGMVRYIGASNYAGWQLLKALRVSDRENLEQYVSLQPRYNLIARAIERETLPACEDQGLGVVSYSPLATGFLADVYDRGETPAAGTRLARLWERLDQPAHWETLERVRAVADEKGVTPAQVATAWVLHRPSVDAVITGPSTIEELESYLGALAVTLTRDDLARLAAPVDEDQRPEY
jgi:aryl-alcohol dehydrogenase-like predicted oxidoreductase